MTEGKPISLLWAFTFPTLMGNLLNQVYSITDSIVVGQYLGQTALAAVGSTMPVILLLAALMIGINVGVGIIISRYFGQKNEELMRRAFVNSLYLGLFLSAGMMVRTVGRYHLSVVGRQYGKDHGLHRQSRGLPGPPSFRPYMNYFPVDEGMTIKGAVLVCAGGAFQFRSDRMEGTPGGPMVCPSWLSGFCSKLPCTSIHDGRRQSRPCPGRPFCPSARRRLWNRS